MAVSIIYAFYPVHFYFSCNVDAVKSFTFFIIWIASRSYLYAFSFFFLPSFVLLCIFWFWKVYVWLLSRMVIGYDEGTIMIKMGREVPVASMDTSGKIIWAKHNEIQTVNIKIVGAGFEVSWSLFIIKWDNWKGTCWWVIIFCKSGHRWRKITPGCKRVRKLRSIPTGTSGCYYALCIWNLLLLQIYSVVAWLNLFSFFIWQWSFLFNLILSNLLVWSEFEA